GPALAWAATVVPVHVAVAAGGTPGEEPRGYSPPYQLAVGTATLLLSLATLLFTYGIARRFAPPVCSAAGAACGVLGTPLLGYGAVEVAMAHGPAAAALSGYVYLWLRTCG